MKRIIAMLLAVCMVMGMAVYAAGTASARMM